MDYYYWQIDICVWKCYDFVMGNDYNEMVYECEMIYACERVGLHDGLLWKEWNMVQWVQMICTVWK